MPRTPLYKTVETEMLRRIRAGDWKPGHRLPNEFVLAAEFDVSQGTMRRALMAVEAMGHLSRKPGRGTIVSDVPATRSVPTTATFEVTDATGAPLALDVFRSRAATRGASQEDAALFGHARIATLERTLKHAGARTALDEIAIPEAHAARIPEDAPLELPELLHALALPATTYIDTLTATMATMSQSVALSTDRHTALLVQTRTAMSGTGKTLARQTRHFIAEGLTARTSSQD